MELQPTALGKAPYLNVNLSSVNHPMADLVSEFFKVAILFSLSILALSQRIIS